MSADIEQAVACKMSEEARRRSSDVKNEQKEEAPRSLALGSVHGPVTEAPRSMGLSLSLTTQPAHGGLSSHAKPVKPKLAHPLLEKIPLQARFGVNGVFSNVLFMVAYNVAVETVHTVAPSTIYAVLYFFFIPIGHAMVSLFVFGWPERYLTSLLSNFPIGLTAMGLGAFLTAYLDKIGFEENIEEFIRDNYSFSSMPNRTRLDEKHEFYSSIVVLIVTSLWTYVLSVYINMPSAKSAKKEL